jgi:pimeloyl-ACP methyl ester carboxylesterase
LELHVTERGDPTRSTIVLVHGFPDTSAVWRPVAELLEADFHVVTYDVRGAGASDVPATRPDYALPLLAVDVAAVSEATSPDRPVHLVAHDWGSIQGWEAVTTTTLESRFASYTSISGPPIDHAGLWARRHRTLRAGDLWRALWQAAHSWYIAYFHLPYLPELLARNRRATAMWSRALHRIEGANPDAEWPAQSFSTDFAHGVELYRANVLPRFRHPQERHTDVPVQLLVPRRDRYVTPQLLDGLETWATRFWRRDLDAGHWVIRTDPGLVAQAVRDVIAAVDDGVESPELSRSRVA